jgi:predicted dehydrogenase
MLTLALIGCGGMGRRHLRGLHKLQSIGAQRFRLVAVVDIFAANAELAAQQAEELLGERPRIFSSLAEMQAAIGAVDGVVVTTMPDSHAQVGAEAFDLGINVMVEKPIALTVEQGIELIAAAEKTGRKLAVAENYRRDPINRLAKALIEAGVLGSIHLAIQSSSGSGERVIITPWRHRKESGGIVVDMGIHYADLLEYFVGPIRSVYGLNATIDQRRVDAEGTWHEVDAEDLSVGVARFENGAIGNYLIDCAGRGEGHFSRLIYGSRGSLSIPHDRSGKQLKLSLRKNGSDTAIGPDEQLALVPDFELDDVTAQLFGGKRLGSYELSFADIDANLLAIEQDDFASAIVNDRQPEVDGHFALRSLAIAYGFIESELVGRPLDVDTLVRGQESPYQASIISTAGSAR